MSYLDELPEDVRADIAAIGDGESVEQAADDDEGVDLPESEEQGDAPSKEAEKPTEEEGEQESEAEEPAKEPEVDDDAKRLKKQLRASRYGETRWRNRSAQLERLVKELEAQRSSQPDEDEQLLEDLRADFPDSPQIAKLEKKLREAKELKQLAAAKPASDEGFEPALLPDYLQEAVNEVPDAWDWQHDPEKHELWSALCKQDDALSALSKWRGKPHEERIAAAVRLVKAELGEEEVQPAPQQKQTQTQAKKPLQAKPAPRPGVSDLSRAASSGSVEADIADMSQSALERLLGIRS